MRADMNMERTSLRFHPKGKTGQVDSQASNIFSVMASYSSLFRSISDSLEPLAVTQLGDQELNLFMFGDPWMAVVHK